MKIQYLLWSLILTLVSCDSCPEDPHCPPRYNELSFELFSSEGNDLINGPHKKYVPSDIKVFAIDTQNKRIDAEISVKPSNDANTLMSANIYPEMKRTFLEINNKVTDTLDLTFETQVHKCCGTLNTINQITINGILKNKSDLPLQITVKD